MRNRQGFCLLVWAATVRPFRSATPRPRLAPLIFLLVTAVAKGLLWASLDGRLEKHGFINRTGRLKSNYAREIASTVTSSPFTTSVAVPEDTSGSEPGKTILYHD